MENFYSRSNRTAIPDYEPIVALKWADEEAMVWYDRRINETPWKCRLCRRLVMFLRGF